MKAERRGIDLGWRASLSLGERESCSEEDESAAAPCQHSKHR